MDKLRAFINKLDTDSQHAFAMSVGTTINYLRKTMSAKKRLSPKVCVAIEVQSRQTVKRTDLRDDWRDIWPELIPKQRGRKPK